MRNRIDELKNKCNQFKFVCFNNNIGQFEYLVHRKRLNLNLVAYYLIIEHNLRCFFLKLHKTI